MRGFNDTCNDAVQEDEQSIAIEVYLARVPQLPFFLAWDAELVAEGAVLLKHLQYIDQQGGIISISSVKNMYKQP